MTVELWPHQVDALRGIQRDRALGVRRTACVVGTGGGKTTIMAELGREHIAAGGRRVLYVVHRRELVDQIVDRVRRVAPGQTVGAVQGVRNACQAQHVVASVATLGGERGAARRRMIRGVDLGVVDECHHAAAQSYMDVFGHYGTDVDWVGFTATLSRSDRKSLGRVWKSVAYERGVGALISDGHLVRPTGVRVRVEDLDLASVKRSGGDLAKGDLGRALESSMAPEALAKALREHASDRPTILFAPTVHSARVIEAAVRAAGFTTGLVWGEMEGAVRDRVLSDFRAGSVQVLVNCMVLTEGTDLPLTSCIAIARPTKSKALYQQMVGRGLRRLSESDWKDLVAWFLARGEPMWITRKTDCLVLDLVGVAHLGLSSCTDLFGEEKDEKARERAVCTGDACDLGCSHAACWEDCGCGWVEGHGCSCVWMPAEPEETDEPIYADGPLVSEVVDLFGDSGSMWLRTNRGVPFIPAGERYVFVVPSDPADRLDPAVPEYEVVSAHWQDSGPGSASYVMTGLTDFASAMQYAENNLTLAERRAASKEDGFRKRRVHSTAYQHAMARVYGISADPKVLASELQVQLAVAGASGRIDPLLPEWY